MPEARQSGVEKRIVLCPRCGYDQRGVIESWNEACPLTGRCAECGLEFEWRHLFDPMHTAPRWCIEYARGLTGFALALVLTPLNMLRPWWFWRKLRIEHTPRWRRIALVYLIVLAGTYGGFIGSLGAFVYFDPTWTPSPNMSTPVPPGELARRTMLMPFSDATPGSYRYFGRTMTIPSPRVYTMSFLYWMREFSEVLVFLLLYLLLCPVGFGALPQSRRRAKVRWAHVIRIAAYSLLVMPLLLCLIMVLTAVDRAGGYFGLLVYLLGLGVAVFGVGQIPWMIVWWSFATSRYLRMRHAWGVGLAVAAMAFLASLLAMILYSIATFRYL